MSTTDEKYVTARFKVGGRLHTVAGEVLTVGDGSFVLRTAEGQLWPLAESVDAIGSRPDVELE